MASLFLRGVNSRDTIHWNNDSLTSFRLSGPLQGVLHGGNGDCGK